MDTTTSLVSLVTVFALLIYGFDSSKAQLVPAMFVFGDSLVDVGNNNHLPLSTAKANFPHNGVDFANKKATGRFSNGKNAADLLAQKLGLPTSPPYLSLSSENASGFMTGVSFASGGAGIFNGTDEKLAQSIPLTKQVGYYESVYQSLVKMLEPSGAEDRISKSIFLVVIGSNDIFGYPGTEKTPPQQYVDSMVITLKALLQRLHSSGARKFVFPAVGALGCIPSERVKNQTEECNESTNSLAVAYNKGLKSMLQELKAELKDVSYTYFDTYTMLQNFVQNPANNGFSEVKAACCGLGKLKAKFPCLPISTYCPNRRDHVWWDLYHPTEAAATILVDAIFDGPLQFSSPINVRQLVAL